ncbi:hypothetical protein NDU88_001810 [Pleurodeles waltl]|uniref:Uncharacterized protein n=1 Tax=Pleurodeles waltl TaxID=8319 RepID=A0AAV7SDS1_PLEWA|nr:hypothetical protein NDU88_001810 [Pleurodeles waltl]
MHRRALQLGPHKWKAPVERNVLIGCKGGQPEGNNHWEPMRERKVLKTGFRSDRHTIRAFVMRCKHQEVEAAGRLPGVTMAADLRAENAGWGFYSKRGRGHGELQILGKRIQSLVPKTK